jgi:hypothetical protein
VLDGLTTPEHRKPIARGLSYRTKQTAAYQAHYWNDLLRDHDDLGPESGFEVSFMEEQPRVYQLIWVKRA